MKKSISSYPGLAVDADGTGVVSHAGAVTLLRAAEKVGLTSALSAELQRWRKPKAVQSSGLRRRFIRS